MPFYQNNELGSICKPAELGKKNNRETYFIIFPENYFIYITDFMELGTSCEAAGHATTQVIPNILQNPKVYYRIHKSPPQIPVLSQKNPIHTTPSYLSNIHINIIHLCLFLSSDLFLFGFPTNILYAFLFSLFMPHALSISSSLF
jgi:hypothetical protein